jgi:uncharacterized OB-fold protein
MKLHPEHDYLAYLAEGRFMIQRARGSGKYVFYPRVAEPVTGDTDLEWVEASGQGIVYSVTVIPRRPPAPDTNVVLVDLSEGPRMISRVEGIAPAGIRIGMKVQAKIIQEDEAPLVVFEPVA